MPAPRTKATASAVIMELYPEAASELADPGIRTVFTASMVEEVFNQAWKHQFEDDRNSFQARLRDIVREAVENMSARHDI